MLKLQLPLPELATHFQLDPDITFLNHGSYGACPKPVFDVYQNWQRELERNPVEFIGMRLPDLLTESRNRFGPYLGSDPDNIVYVRNATFGINIVARSLKLNPGDEVLTTNHEYGAVNNTWQFNCDRQGAVYVNCPISLPIEDPQDVVDQLWAGVTEKTKVISISHITSPTALIMPVEEICKRAGEAGITTVIDGAHAPGQIDLNMEAIGADYYSGNAHKWLSSPKGAAFLYARPERQEALDPLSVSHGWHRPNSDNSQFLDYFSATGTDDPASFLSVPAAIKFQEKNDWPKVRAACNALLREAESRILALSNLPSISPDSMFSQLRAISIPGKASDYIHFWEKYKIIVPIFEWNGHTFVRVSVQGYNTPEDIDRLVDAIADVVGR